MLSSMTEVAYIRTAYEELMKYKTNWEQFSWEKQNTSNGEVENMNSEDF